MNADGSGERRITGHAQGIAYPEWSPDGSQIIFHKHQSDEVYSINIMDADGSHERRLTQTDTQDAAPVWSPDGSQIAFTRDEDIWVMNADGSDQILIMDDPVASSGADWSPDGGHIVFESGRHGNTEIYVMQSDGSNLQRLTNNEAEDWWPSWSPDGNQIAFMSTLDGDWEIFMMDATGGNLRQLTENTVDDRGPAWSPDGTRIAFVSSRDTDQPHETEIYVMNADGSDQQRITEKRGFEWGVDWRPDISQETSQPATTPAPIEPSLSINVPEGSPLVIDGRLSEGEWDEATVETFGDGSELLLMHADGYLYLGIRANTPGMIAGNVFIQSGNEIAILHSSAALGTAIYQKGDDNWQQVQDFTWQCRSTSLSESAQAERDAFLQQEGWVAANGRMGTPNELEYQIKIPEQDFHLAAVYIKSSPPYEKVPWPAGLDDDCIKQTPGGLPESLYFSPEQWMMISILNHGED